MKAIQEQHSLRPGEGDPRAIRVLAYHRIVDNRRLSEAHWSCVHIEHFRKHLELIDRLGFSTMTFRDYLLYLRGHLNLPAKPLILSFDDGYQDTYRFAFPLLKEFGMTAVMFVLGDRKIKTNYWDLGNNVPDAALMDQQQIIELHEAGFEIGAHSMTHVKLTAVHEGRAWEEISRSRILLEFLLNDTVHTFSYPYGQLNPTVKRMVQNAGYSFACGVYTGPAVFGKDVYEIRRMTVINTLQNSGLALRLLTPYHYYNWLRWKIRRALNNGQPIDSQLREIMEKKRQSQKMLQKAQIMEEYDIKG